MNETDLLPLTLRQEPEYSPRAPLYQSEHGPLLEEVPVAFAFNGTPYAVMMATPTDLQDFAVGFTYAEGIVTDLSEILDVCLAPYVEPKAEGVSVHLTLRRSALERLDTSRREALGTVACGLCGTASIAAALRPLPKQTPLSALPSDSDVLSTMNELSARQEYKRATGAAHGAAVRVMDGTVRDLVVREDIGRHTALDKVIGAWLRGGAQRPALALTTSRCSVELVQKVAMAGLQGLATAGAPTALAVETARTAGLVLFGRVRGDTVQRFA